MFGPPKSPRVKGSLHPRFEEILTPEALAFVAKLDGAHSGRRAELLAARRERGKRISAGEQVDFLTSTAEIRSGRLVCRAAGSRARGPAGGDHRAADPQDEHQRAELRRARCGWPTSRTPPRRAGPTSSTARSTCTTPSAATWSSPPRTARNTRSARPPRPSSSARAAGGCARSTSASTGARCPPRWSTSGCSSSTTRSS